jgi:MarR-like DNA-binding transcriptional regulator SgrR of sgrS sRNA
MSLPESAVFYVLLERSDNDTCAIPLWMTPSLVQLAEAVHCSKSAAAAALDHLSAHGWVIRQRTKGGRTHKTTYQLAHGGRCPGPPRCQKRSTPRTVSAGKRSETWTEKRSTEHSQEPRSERVLDEGLQRRGGEEGKGPAVCRICRRPLEALWPAAGFTTHPWCQPSEISSIYPVTDINR